VKVEFNLEQAMKTWCGSRGIDYVYSFFNLTARRGWVTNAKVLLKCEKITLSLNDTEIKIVRKKKL
jgi:hypothetical protein